MIVKGIASWAKVYPDHYDSHPKYGDKWTINLAVSDKDAKNLIKLVPKASVYKKGKNGPPIPNEEGVYEFRFKRKLKTSKGPKAAPVIVDAQKKPFTSPIGNGSVVVIQYTTYEYEGDNFVDLQGVQVLEHVALGAGKADGAEFEAVDGDTGEDVNFEDEGNTDDNPFA